MSNIFDINTLLSENTMADKLLAKSFPEETYVFSAMNSLRTFNSSVVECSKSLYSNLNEATSKSEENAIFGDFYNRYSFVLKKYIDEVSTMVDRFKITLDNLVDANMSLVNDQDVLGCDKTFTCMIKRYKNLTGGKYPKFNPIEIYQKEFDYIGQLMQDLGPISTDVAKLEVIASVCNSFGTKMKNKWLEKCIEDITGEDDCNDLSCYAEILMKLFTEDEDSEIVVNKGTIFAMREELSGYEKYKDAVCGIASKLINDFAYMSKNIGSMFYRNKDNVLPVRSNDENIHNRDYQLNTYGMNQLDIFMKNKANQVSQMCSLYVIALSIMMDNIIAHITQCKSLLEKVKEACSTEEDPDGVEDTQEPEDMDGTPEVPEEPESDDIDTPPSVPEEPPATSSIEYDDKNASPEEKPISEEEPEEEPMTSEEGPDVEPSEPEEEPISGDDNEIEVSNKEEEEFKNETYMFECLMYAIDDIMLQESLINHVLYNVLKEEVNPTVGVDTGDVGIIQKIFIAFNKIFARFTEVFQKRTIKMSEFMAKQAGLFGECKFDTGDGYKVSGYNIDILNNLAIQKLNYQQMEQFMGSQDQFLEKYYPEIQKEIKEAGEGTKISAAIQSLVEPNPETKDIVNSSNYKKLLDYMTSFPKTYKSLQQASLDIKNAQVMSKNIIKNVEAAQKSQSNTQTTGNTTTAQNASAYITADDYFTEDVETPKAEDVKADGGGSGANTAGGKLKVYFKVMTNIVCAKMSMSQKIFNDYFKLLNAVLKNNGKPSYGPQQDQEPKKEG